MSGKRIADYLYQEEMQEILPKPEPNPKNPSFQNFPEEFSCSASLADLDAVWLPLTPLRALQVPDQVFSFPEILDGIEEDNDEEVKEIGNEGWGLKIRDCVFRWTNSGKSLNIEDVVVPYGKLLPLYV